MQTNNFMGEKFEDSKKQLQAYDAKIFNFVSIERVQQVQQEIKSFKYETERDYESLQDYIKDVKDKIGELSKRF